MLARITELFTRLARGKKDIQIPYAHISTVFKLENSQYENKERSDMHGVIRFKLGTSDYLRGPHYGPTQTYFSDPTKTLEIEEEPQSPFYDGPNLFENAILPASPGILCAKYKTWNRKDEIALTIRGNVTHPDQDPVIFAMLGVKDHDDNFTFKKIMIPRHGTEGQILPVKDIPVTAENITRALAYAGMCTEQLLETPPFNPFANLHRAGTIDWENKQPSWKTPPPPSI